MAALCKFFSDCQMNIGIIQHVGEDPAVEHKDGNETNQDGSEKEQRNHAYISPDAAREILLDSGRCQWGILIDVRRLHFLCY